MIYLVSNQLSLFETDKFTRISVDDAIDILRPHKNIEFDTETAGLDPYTKPLLCSQYGVKDTQIVVDNTTIPIEKMRPILEDKDTTLLTWNGSFDLRFLYYNKIVPYNIWDGMIAERLLYLGYPAAYHSLSLKAAADCYLGIDIDKTVRGQIITQGLTIPVIQYAAGDVTYLTSIKEKQETELKKKDLVKAAQFEMYFVPVIAYLEFCGMLIDPDKWRQKMMKDEEALGIASEKLNNWVVDYYLQNKGSTPGTIKVKTESVPLMDEIKLINTVSKNKMKRVVENDLVHYEYDQPFPYITPFPQLDLFASVNKEAKCVVNWSSPKQVVPLLEHLGLNCTVIDKKTKEKKKSCDKKLIEPQVAKSPIVPLFVDYKKAETQVSTFGKKFLDNRNPVTKRIHPDYHQLGSDTGRISASNPSLLNLPRDAYTRSCFTAEKGNKFVSCDYTG